MHPSLNPTANTYTKQRYAKDFVLCYFKNTVILGFAFTDINMYRVTLIHSCEIYSAANKTNFSFTLKF